MKQTEIYESLPNIFEDLGRPDAKVHFLKAQIVGELFRMSTTLSLDDAAVASRLAVSSEEVSRMFRGDFRAISIERLMDFLNAFDQDVEIVARPRPSEAPEGGTVTFRAA